MSSYHNENPRFIQLRSLCTFLHYDVELILWKTILHVAPTRTIYILLLISRARELQIWRAAKTWRIVRKYRCLLSRGLVLQHLILEKLEDPLWNSFHRFPLVLHLLNILVSFIQPQLINVLGISDGSLLSIDYVSVQSLFPWSEGQFFLCVTIIR